MFLALIFRIMKMYFIRKYRLKSFMKQRGCEAYECLYANLNTDEECKICR